MGSASSRLDVTKLYYRAGGKEQVRECLFKVSWDQKERNNAGRRLPAERQITVGTTLAVDWETHRILGASAVGEQALEIVQIAAAGMAADMWVEQLAEMELAYPTFTAIVGLAARRIVHRLGVVPLAPEWRALATPHAAEWERRD